MTKSTELRTQRFDQNSEIVKDNILALVRTSLESSKLTDFDPVLEQLTTKISTEFENQKQVHLASYEGIATEFFNNLIAALRAANTVCAGKGSECNSDLGAFLSEELIREEQDEAADEEQPAEGEAATEEEAATEGEATTESEADTEGEAATEGEATTEGEAATEGDASSEGETATEGDASTEGENDTSTSLDNTESATEGGADTALAVKGARKISKALFAEALRVYNHNRMASIKDAKTKSKMKNMAVVPIF